MSTATATDFRKHCNWATGVLAASYVAGSGTLQLLPGNGTLRE
jgi:hypothetical protein